MVCLRSPGRAKKDQLDPDMYNNEMRLPPLLSMLSYHAISAERRSKKAVKISDCNSYEFNSKLLKNIFSFQSGLICDLGK